MEVIPQKQDTEFQSKFSMLYIGATIPTKKIFFYHFKAYIFC